MRHHDLAFLRGRLENTEAHFEGRFTPAAIMKQWPVVNDGVVEFLQLRFPAMGTARNGNFLFALFGIDKKTVGRLANIAFLTGDYCESEKGLTLFST